MDLTILTSTHQNLLLSPCVSSTGYSDIPGSSSWSSESEHGTIHYQEVRRGPYTIRYSFFQFFKKVTLYFKMVTPQAGVRIAMENRWNVALQGEDPVTVLKNQFVLFFPGSRGEKIVFEKDQQYRGIEILCDPEKMAELIRLFPGTEQFVMEGEKFSTYLQKKPILAPDQALDMLHDVKDLSTIDRLRAFLESILKRVKELVEEMMPTPGEIKAVKRAERLIMKDFRVHYRIPEIATKVKLNEYRLKFIFRHLYKDSIYQYQMIARMEKAKTLLQDTKKSMEAIAKAIGYLYLTSFITAFRKHYGYTPRSVRRQGK
jgi:AraC family transcriptional activator of pyochelin receptor